MQKSSLLKLSLNLALAVLPVCAPAQDNRVTLVASSQTSNSISTGQTNTFCAQFGSPTSANTVLLDIELYNSNNQRLAQNFWNNIYIAQGGITPLGSYCLSSPGNLAADTYRWAVGVFTPNWSQLLNWYGQPATFTASSAAQPGNVVLSSSALTVSSGLHTLNATFMNTGAAKTVLLDLELINSSNQRVAQNYADNVNIGTNGQYQLSLTEPMNLPAGTYTFVAGIFNPGWNGRLSWYGNVQQFTVTGTPPQQGSVTLSSGQILPSNSISAGTPATFQASFSTPTPPSQSVLIDLEVINTANGQRVAQQWYDNQTISSNPQTYAYTVSSGLPTGTYTLKVGIFNPGWSSLLTWYDNVQTLTVH